MMPMKLAREAALIEDKLAHYPPEVAERAKLLMRTTPLPAQECIDRAIRVFTATK